MFLGCDFYGFNASVAALAEIWSLAFVSFDRFLAIYFPLDRRKRITKSQVSNDFLYEFITISLKKLKPLSHFCAEAHYFPFDRRI